MDKSSNTVYCRVHECKYHEKGDTCGANEILINCMSDDTRVSENTLCQTFKCDVH